jgi:hypothetical protein
MTEIWHLFERYPIVTALLAIGLSAWIGYVERRHFVRREISSVTFAYTALLAIVLLIAVLYMVWKQ